MIKKCTSDSNWKSNLFTSFVFGIADKNELFISERSDTCEWPKGAAVGANILTWLAIEHWGETVGVWPVLNLSGIMLQGSIGLKSTPELFCLFVIFLIYFFFSFLYPTSCCMVSYCPQEGQEVFFPSAPIGSAVVPSSENCPARAVLGKGLGPRKELTPHLLYPAWFHLLPYDGDANTFSFALGCLWLESSYVSYLKCVKFWNHFPRAPYVFRKKWSVYDWLWCFFGCLPWP